MELRQFLAVILKRLWLILFATVLVTGMTFLLSITSTPIYQSTTTVEIDQGADPRSDPYSALRTSEMVASTYVEQMRAPVLLREVARRLGLELSPGQLQEMLSVEQIRDTQLIRIAAESSDPALAQALAETVAQVFIAREAGQQQARFQAGLDEIEAQIAQVEASIETTQRAVVSLGDPMDPQNVNMPEFARLELTGLESQLTSDQTRLVILLRSAEDFRLAMARYTDVIAIFSPAELPASPVRPRTMLNAVLGLISGAVLGVSTAFLLEYLDDTIRTAEDVRQALPLGVLGALPQLKEGNDQVRLVVADQPLQPMAEAFRNLRTSVQFSSVDRPARSLLVTSPLPTDGKTFVAANLAAVLAQGGQRVVLVDADLRHPMQHRVFGMTREPGLTAALLSPEERWRAIRKTEVDGLWLVATGAHPHNPAELLASQTFRDFAAWLSAEADTVVYDSPPVLAVTDAALLSALVDGTLLVVDCGVTRRPAAAQALERLSSVGGKVLGVVLNRMAPSADGYYYYHHYYSGEGGPAPGQSRAGAWIARLRNLRRGAPPPPEEPGVEASK